MLLDRIRQITNHKVNILHISFYLLRPCLLGLWYLRRLDSCRVKSTPFGFTLNNFISQPCSLQLTHAASSARLTHLSHLNRPSDINVTEPSPDKFVSLLISWNKNTKYTHPEI